MDIYSDREKRFDRSEDTVGAGKYGYRFFSRHITRLNLQCEIFNVAPPNAR